MKIDERLDWAPLVTPKLLRARSIYRWYVYPHSYDKQLVISLLDQLGVRKNSWVWDPFLGAGTTALACREFGCHAWGTDLLPLSVLVTRAKLAKYDPNRLYKQLEQFSFLTPQDTIDRFAPVPIVNKAINLSRRRQISFLLDQIDAITGSSKLFYRLVLLRCMNELSLAVKSGGWLRIESERDIKGISLRSLFHKHAKDMLSDLDSVNQLPGQSYNAIIEIADARIAKSSHSISACITSPPYLNRHDYTRVFALELALTGVRSPDELIQLRYRTLRSHVEAKPLEKFRDVPVNLPRKVMKIVSMIEDAGTNNAGVPSMVRGYFEDMQLVLRNIARNLKPRGVAALVVGNTRFSGVMIPVDEILIKMGPSVGLQPDQIIATRYRGNSAQQMGLFGREPSRESVVIFRKSK